MTDQTPLGREKPVCNLEYLLINLGRNHAAALRLVRIFLDNYPLLMGRLEEAVNKADWPAVKDAAHDIRSSCVLFSADIAVTHAKAIESILHQHADDPEHVNWSEKIAALRIALQRVAEELHHYLESSSVQ